MEHSKREVVLMANVYNRSGGKLMSGARLEWKFAAWIVLDLFLNAIILAWFNRLKKRQTTV